MTVDEYERRIREVEAHYDARLFAADYRQRLYPPDAEFILAYVHECIESDVYECDRPPIDTGRPWMDAVLKIEIARWDALWENDGR